MTPDEPNRVPARPAAIILDGTIGALSAARSLGRQGITVYALTEPAAGVRFSRYVRWIGMEDGGSPESWERFLLGPESDYLAGSVLLTCSDPAIDIVARNAAKLAEKFLIEEGEPETRLCLLDKFRTYQQAAAAGIPTVAYEFVQFFSQLQAVADQFRFPVILKPIYSPDAALLGGKFVMATDKSELFEKSQKLLPLGAKCVVMEFVPGGDDLLCSYYTYMDEAGTPLVEFTKHVLRRSPVHMGIATYHVTDWNPEVAALGRRFFQHVKLKGIGNIEFKRDPRDGQLKVIEANARFTSGDPVLVKSGVDLATITYNRLTNRPLPPRVDYEKGLVLWLPVEDMQAFFQLRARGEITLAKWLRSVVRARQLPYLAWDDPLPSLHIAADRAIQLIRTLQSRIVVRRGAGFSRETPR